MTPLSREHITREALRLIDAEGLDALSMRKLGKAMGVDAKAMYYYFPHKEALIAGVLESAFAQMDLPPVLQGSWKSQLRQIAIAYAKLVGEHPNLLPFLMTLDGSIPVVFQIVERIVAALKDTGLKARSIFQIVDLFASFVPTFTLSVQREVSTAEQVYARVMALPTGEFSAVQSLLKGLSIEELDEDFEYQLETVLLGIEERIRKETIIMRS
ncbi:MAG: TetR/AcrR family transcriptional regulator C-terminal domain-containing protein [Chloroflexi bacterium]|nr:TetR/AcrR family transcriptional regulator C-terminal domain-containing protein [Chloroflexota bacterium]